MIVALISVPSTPGLPSPALVPSPPAIPGPPVAPFLPNPDASPFAPFAPFAPGSGSPGAPSSPLALSAPLQSCTAASSPHSSTTQAGSRALWPWLTNPGWRLQRCPFTFYVLRGRRLSKLEGISSKGAGVRRWPRCVSGMASRSWWPMGRGLSSICATWLCRRNENEGR